MIVCEVEKPDRFLQRVLHRHREGALRISRESNRDTIGISAELDMRRIGSGQSPADEPRGVDQQMMLPRVVGLHPIRRDLASEPRQPHHPLRDGGLYDRMLLIVLRSTVTLASTA